MPKVKKHQKKLSDGDKGKVLEINSSISSSNVSSSSSSLGAHLSKKSKNLNSSNKTELTLSSINNNNNNNNDNKRPRSSSIVSKNSQLNMNILPKNNNNNNNDINNNNLSATSTFESSTELNNFKTKSVDNAMKRRASKRTNRRFHQLFPSISISEQVIDTYSCAYVKSLNLLHGVMFLTKNYICFYSKILSAENILIIKLQHINSIKKTMHALIFPTAIRIETQNSGYQFTSFRSRSNTLDHLIKLLANFQQNLANQSFKLMQMNEQSDSSKPNENRTGLEQVDLASEEDDSDEYYDKEQDLTSELLSNSDEDMILDKNNNNLKDKNRNTPVITYFNNFVSYDQYNKDNSNCNINEVNKNSVSLNSNSSYKYYDIDYSDLSNRKVTVSLRHKKTLIEKVKILISLMIPAFFDISRIDSLLPICFLMCILLLLNAFVLLSKVSKVDELFADLLIQSDSVII